MRFNMKRENPENLRDIKGQITLSREGTRTWLAKSVVYIFIIVLLIITCIGIFTDIKLDSYNFIISPLSGLLGVVLGFYFAKENDI
jgi:hypothetical protein